MARHPSVESLVVLLFAQVLHGATFGAYHAAAVAAVRAAPFRVGRERILRLGHTDRVVAVALLLQAGNPGPHRRVGRNVGCAIDLRGNRLHLVPQAVGVLVDKSHLGRAGLGQPDHRVRQFLGTGRAFGPMAGHHHRHALALHVPAQHREFGLGVTGEVIQRHDTGQTMPMADVLDVPLQIGQALLHRGRVGRREVLQVHAAVVLERAQRRHDHHGIRPQP